MRRLANSVILRGAWRLAAAQSPKVPRLKLCAWALTIVSTTRPIAMSIFSPRIAWAFLNFVVLRLVVDEYSPRWIPEHAEVRPVAWADGIEAGKFELCQELILEADRASLDHPDSRA